MQSSFPAIVFIRRNVPVTLLPASCGTSALNARVTGRVGGRRDLRFISWIDVADYIRGRQEITGEKTMKASLHHWPHWHASLSAQICRFRQSCVRRMHTI